jgi:hypothetical protein
VSRYTASAVHDGRWWTIEVSGVGFTQARTVAEARDMVDDLVRLLHDDPTPQVDITFRVGKVDATAMVERVRNKAALAEAAQRDAAKANRDAARTLNAAGVSGNDIAGLLQVSPQRVSQLLAADPALTPRRNATKTRSPAPASAGRVGARASATKRGQRG